MNPEQRKEWNHLCYIKEVAKADAERYEKWAEVNRERLKKAERAIHLLKTSPISDKPGTAIDDTITRQRDSKKTIQRNSI